MKSREIFRNSAAWIILIMLAVSAIVYVWFNFDRANSLINVEIKMSREAALTRAVELSETFHLGPEKYKQAAAFTNDNHFQNFAELEGGGLDSLIQCLERSYYMAYRWSVRHFREHEAREVVFWFTPAGGKYGFSEKIPESEKGAALDEDRALAIAEQHAVYDWDIDFSNYMLIEKSKEARISGRIDHTFVYERKDVHLGESRYRLKLVVTGDKLSTVENYVKIPEDFDRRYSEMRSSNDTIQSVSTAVIVLIYGLFGVLIGLFYLIRKRLLIWDKPVFWGMGIAFASVFLITLNSLPFSWFSYDTSSSQNNFLFRELLSGLAGSAGFGSIIALSLMAAEGLGRQAFPAQIQLWKIWGKGTASTWQVLGQTISGYLFAAIILGIDVLYYVFTTEQFGWWSPAGTLSDPNILATYFPWLDSIAISLQAGFWEEALFRAVPIAGVFLLTRNRKSRILWIIAILLIQTLVFGSAHANYPNQPSYARVIEMVIPFTIMGIIYIYYGLLPAVISHFAVDVFWISLPLWISSSAGIWIDRILVLIFFLFPVWVVLYSRFRNRKWKEVPEDSRNAAWVPPEGKEERTEVKPQAAPSGKFHRKLMIPLGIAGLIAWCIFSPVKSDSLRLGTSRSEAVELAAEVISEKYGIQISEWKILSYVSNRINHRDIFAWRIGGKENYEKLLGKYLPPPGWKIRFVKTEGRVEDRAEEFSVVITGKNKVVEVNHHIPEAWPGENLEKEEVQLLVDSILMSDFSIERNNLKEISVIPEKLENRTDWEFIYADTLDFPLEQGQGRYRINISGDEISAVHPYLFVPEEWTREYTASQNINSIFKTVGLIILIGVILFGLIWGIIRWTKRKFSLTVFVVFTLLYLFFSVTEIINGWPDALAGYSTQLPLSNFLVQLMISMAISVVFISLFSGIYAGFSIQLLSPGNKPDKLNLLHALCLGFLIAALLSLMDYLAPRSIPEWITLEGMNSYVPWLGFGISDISGLMIFPAYGITLFRGLDVITSGWTKLKIIAYPLFIAAGLGISAAGFEDVTYWLISGILAGLALLVIYLYFIRFHFEWIPVSFGLIPVFKTLPVMAYGPFPEAVPGGILFIILSAGILFFWYRQLIFVKNYKI